MKVQIAKIYIYSISSISSFLQQATLVTTAHNAELNVHIMVNDGRL